MVIIFSGCAGTNYTTKNISEVNWQGAKTTRLALLPNVKNEVQMGYGVDAFVQQNFVLLDDPQLTQKLNQIGNRLLSSSNKRGIAYRFKIVNHNDLNAFSAPGGFVYITYGLLRLAQKEDEVAGILAHEIAHVEFRHQMKVLRTQQAAALLLGGASLGLNAFGGQTSARALETVGPIAMLVSLNTFSRTQETQADDYAIYLMIHAGYDPKSLAQILRRLYLEKDRKGELSKLPSIFVSHPPTPERIQRITSKTEQIGTQNPIAKPYLAVDKGEISHE